MVSSSDPANAGLFETLQSSPYKITSTNHSAYILLSALIFFSVTALVVFIKVYTAWTVFKKLRMDDYAAVAALVRVNQDDCSYRSYSHACRASFSLER